MKQKYLMIPFLIFLLLGCSKGNEYPSSYSSTTSSFVTSSLATSNDGTSIIEENKELNNFLKNIDFDMDTDAFIYNPDIISSHYSKYNDVINDNTSNQKSLEKRANNKKLIYKDKIDFESYGGHYDLGDEILEVFFVLSDLTTHEFEDYCGVFYPITIDEHVCFARIQINETVGELEYSLLMGQSFYNFSAFYITHNGDSDVMERHYDYVEGDQLFIIANYLDFTLVDGKISFPMNVYNMDYIEGNHGYSNNYYNLKSEDDFHMYDITNAYSLLKYPYSKYINSSVLQTLLYIGNCDFEKLPPFFSVVDHYLNQSTNVSGARLDGLNFYSNKIYIQKSEEGYVFSDTELVVNCLNCNLFRIDGGHLGLYYYDSNAYESIYIDLAAEKKIEKYTVTFTFAKEVPQSELLFFEDYSFDYPCYLVYYFYDNENQPLGLVDFNYFIDDLFI